MQPFELIRPTTGNSLLPPDKPIVLSAEDPIRGDPACVPYVLDASLAVAINTAIAVDQPLLVTGEPGCGKTTLAWAIASQLGTTVEAFHVKSTSTARDLLYSMDNLRRFHDANSKVELAGEPRHYLRLEALGRAFTADVTRVVLIDEIDKAPRDLPNDLLRELDEKAFTIVETGEVVRQRVPQVIVITSNRDRQLSDAFLRRCVYAHIPFPSPEVLVKVIAAHAGARGVGVDLVDAAVRRFGELRDSGLEKKPATSELLAWVLVLHRRGTTAASIEECPLGALPGLELLVKTPEDLHRIVAQG